VGEKLDGDQEIGQPTCLNCSREFLFLESSEIHLNLSVTHERLLCVDPMRYVWSRTICRLGVDACGMLVGFSLQGVHQFESP
jgi:hypothetical protein